MPENQGSNTMREGQVKKQIKGRKWICKQENNNKRKQHPRGSMIDTQEIWQHNGYFVFE
jgi:hypothetical protein